MVTKMVGFTPKQIRVFDYTNARKGGSLSQYDYNNPPDVEQYDVLAYCVGGEDGIRAYFVLEDTLYEAHGDDGHWWLVGVCDIQWLTSIIAELTALESNI